jgi:hypothetical protein
MKIMKKSLLSLVAGLATIFSASAQTGYWQTNYPWTGYPEWTTVADSFQVTAINGDSLWIGDALTGLTASGVSSLWSVGWGTRYVLSVANDELSVTFNPGVDAAWSSFGVNFFEWVGGPAPADTSTMMKYSTIGNYLVNMQPTSDAILNGVIKAEVYIPSQYNVVYADNEFPIRASIFDAHGHEWNAGGDPIDTIASDQYGTWTAFEFDYGYFLDGTVKAETTPGDGWGGSFHAMPRPIPGNDASRAPLDFTKVAGLRFYLCPGVRHTDNTIDGGVVKFRNMTIGDVTSESVSALRLKSQYGVSVAEVAGDSPVASVEVINLLGQTVAVVESIDEVAVNGVAILKVTKEDGSVEVVKVAK